MAEALKGKNLIYKYRKYGDKTAAWMLAFTTENEKSISVDADSTVTKDGVIRTPSAPEIEITATSIIQSGTEGKAVVDTLETNMKNAELYEIWEIDLDAAATTANKYKGWYYQGYCTEFEVTSSAEDFAELSLTFAVNGVGAAGDCTVTAAEIAAAAAYSFTDTVAKS